MQHLETKEVLNETQHGFRKGRSCETQLVTRINDFSRALNQGLQLDTILLDFSKAFDKVDHDKLYIKLEHYGIRGKLLDWVKDSLCSRTQWVIMNGERSSEVHVNSEFHKARS